MQKFGGGEIADPTLDPAHGSALHHTSSRHSWKVEHHCPKAFSNLENIIPSVWLNDPQTRDTAGFLRGKKL